MLVDPTSGRLTAVSQSTVLANETDEEVEQELFLQQIETSTPPCERADDLLVGLRAGRRAVGEAAAAAGARAVAMADPGAARGHRGLHAQVALPAHPGGVRRDGPSGAGLRDAHARRRRLRRGGRPRGRRHPAVAAPARRAGARTRPTGRAATPGTRAGAPRCGAAGPPPVPRSRSATSRPTARCPSRCSGGAPGWTPGCSTSTSGSREAYPTVEIRVADVCTDVEDAAARRTARPIPGRDGRRRAGAAGLARRPAAGRRLAGRTARDRRRPRAPGRRLHLRRPRGRRVRRRVLPRRPGRAR